MYVAYKVKEYHRALRPRSVVQYVSYHATAEVIDSRSPAKQMSRQPGDYSSTIMAKQGTRPDHNTPSSATTTGLLATRDQNSHHTSPRRDFTYPPNSHGRKPRNGVLPLTRLTTHTSWGRPERYSGQTKNETSPRRAMTRRAMTVATSEDRIGLDNASCHTRDTRVNSRYAYDHYQTGVDRTTAPADHLSIANRHGRPDEQVNARYRYVRDLPGARGVLD
ncbi:unnamed protein product, partial [Ectocarpus sp. 12 AP-2014]